MLHDSWNEILWEINSVPYYASKPMRFETNFNISLDSRCTNCKMMVNSKLQYHPQTWLLIWEVSYKKLLFLHRLVPTVREKINIIKSISCCDIEHCLLWISVFSPSAFSKKPKIHKFLKSHLFLVVATNLTQA